MHSRNKYKKLTQSEIDISKVDTMKLDMLSPTEPADYITAISIKVECEPQYEEIKEKEFRSRGKGTGSD